VGYRPVVPNEAHGPPPASDPKEGRLYQEIGSGTLYVVDDASEQWIRLQAVDSPHERRAVPVDRFLSQYAPANSE
jgi:hypothetical protein